MPKPELEFLDPLEGDPAWRPVEGDLTGELTELILSHDSVTGDYTRVLRFPAGADTTPNGTLTHDFWEEVWILNGGIRDLRLGEDFVAGMYACRPPGMEHGPWTSETGALTIEFRYHRQPTQPDAKPNHAQGTSPQFSALVERLRGYPFRADTTPVEDLRTRFDAFAADLSDPPPASFEPADADGVPVEWVTPATAAQTTSSTILFLHGGGYNIGSIATHRDLCARIAVASGVRVLSVGYRLAPEHPFPAAVDDAMTAYRWLLGRGVPADGVVACGDSAGGGLAMALLLAARDAGDPLPNSAVCFSPLVDLAHEGASMVTRAAEDPLVSPPSSHTLAMRYAGDGGNLKHPLASPLYADLRGLPPVFIQVGTAEVLLDDSLRLARRLREAGSVVELDVWPSMIHIFAFFASQVPESRAAIEQAADFVRRRLAGLPAAGPTRGLP